MVAHVGQFMRLHGSTLPFTQQGIEKLNDNITKTYFRSTKSQGNHSLSTSLGKTQLDRPHETLVLVLQNTTRRHAHCVVKLDITDLPVV